MPDTNEAKSFFVFTKQIETNGGRPNPRQCHLTMYQVWYNDGV